MSRFTNEMEGKRVPEVTFRTREGSAWKNVSTRQVFAGKRVVVFALPGAFTPTCSSAHVPRYNELFPALKARGIDSVVCLSVNDAFVMEEWGKAQNATNVTFLPDGNGEFTKGMGMLTNKSDLGFGDRSWRYSMLVDDGVIKKMFVEPDVEGDPFTNSDADTMLKHLDPRAAMPSDVLMIGRAGCSHCARARKLLDSKGYAYDEIHATPRNLRATTGKATTPQIFIDGKHIGGADELEKYFESR
jgi:peroxiredoxin/glutaredoxin